MEKIVSFIANLINTQKQFIKDLKELKNHKDIMVDDNDELNTMLNNMIDETIKNYHIALKNIIKILNVHLSCILYNHNLKYGVKDEKLIQQFIKKKVS